MADLLQVLSMLAIPIFWMLTCRYLIRRQNLLPVVATCPSASTFTAIPSSDGVGSLSSAKPPACICETTGMRL